MLPVPVWPTRTLTQSKETVKLMASPTKVLVTGVYGPGVEPAVKDWQERTGMAASGVVNKRVWRKLRKGLRS